MTTFPVPAEDLQRIDAWLGADWEHLRGARILITGGTGFIGIWLISSILAADASHRLDLRISVLTRSQARFRERVPELADHPHLAVIEGDVRDSVMGCADTTHVIHAAAEASAQLNAERPLEMIDTIVQGTRRMLEFACACSVRRFLFVSSGAVYGRQPPGLSHITEDFRGGPDPLDAMAAYAEAKRLAEQMCAAVARTRSLPVLIARCWAFVGPWLPLDTHFAAGNLIRDGLQGGPLVIRGDGTTERSYLYAADLAAWLCRILLRATPVRPYNVGSGRGLSIAALAEVVAGCSPAVGSGERPRIDIRGMRQPGAHIDRYVPDVTRARTELDLEVWTPLPEAVRMTIAWYRARAKVASPHSEQGR